MKQSSANPANNKIPAGIDEAELINAINLSGYPLQGVVASKLNGSFVTTEEWGFIDKDVKEHRSLDIYAYRSLAEDKSSRIQPSAVLLIECKRSRHPYVFFQNTSDRNIPDFPTVTGIRYNQIMVHERGTNRGRYFSGAAVIGLDKHPFIISGPPTCAAFSRAVPNGKKIDLSGTDIYNGVVLPLVRAHDYTVQLHKAHDQSERLYPVLVINICVMDAPMILVESPSQTNDPILCPWIRIMRQEAVDDVRSTKRYKFYAIDVVHSEFFDEFMTSHLIPLTEEFSKKTTDRGEIFFHEGEADSIDELDWENVTIRKTGIR